MTAAGGRGGPIRRAATIVWPDGTETVEYLTEAQRDGRACIRCGSHTLHAHPVGHINGAGPVYSCCSSSIPASDPGTEPPVPDARTGDSAIKDAWGLTDHQRPAPATLSGGPQAPSRSPGRVGALERNPHRGLGDRRPPALHTVAQHVWAWVGDIILGGVRFGGPLTISGRLPIAPGAPEPDPQSAPPASARLGGPDPHTEQVVTVRRVAWDCLLGHSWCFNSYGMDVREGQSCFESAQLMSSRDFETSHPQLYLAAVARGILTPEPAVV